jgi:hypothetical protein
VRYLRFALFLFLIPACLVLTHAPGSCKPRIKIKLPVNVGVTMAPQPLAGSQESAIMPNSRKPALPVMAKSTSIEPVQWAGEEKAAPAPEEAPPAPRPQSPELTFTPAGDDGEKTRAISAPSPSNESLSYRTCPVDFSQIVEGNGERFATKQDAVSVHSLVARLNEDIFNHYREGLKLDSGSLEKVRFDSPPHLAPSEAGRIVLYKGFRMTMKTAQCFKVLEALIEGHLPGRRIIITSTTGGTHLDARHYEGKAVDFVVEGLTVQQSIYIEYLATQAGLIPFNEYVYSSPYKTGNHMHVDLME